MKKYLAEAIGTFALVFCGTGAVMVDQQSGGSLGLAGVSVAFGAVVMAMVYIFGSVSGTHINPAVTLALAIGKRMPGKDVGGYLFAQIIGACLASALLLLIFPEAKTMGETLPTGGMLAAVVVELVLTFLLMLVILGVTAKKETSHLAGIVIGAFLVGIIFIAGPVSGGSFNPARSLAPAIFAGNFTSLWIYLCAPTVGAILALFVWDAISEKESD